MGTLVNPLILIAATGPRANAAAEARKQSPPSQTSSRDPSHAAPNEGGNSVKGNITDTTINTP